VGEEGGKEGKRSVERRGGQVEEEEEEDEYVGNECAAGWIDSCVTVGRVEREGGIDIDCVSVYVYVDVYMCCGVGRMERG
jgi:hypothetical protein